VETVIVTPPVTSHPDIVEVEVKQDCIADPACVDTGVVRQEMYVW
jgi:hypothetical protein